MNHELVSQLFSFSFCIRFGFAEQSKVDALERFVKVRCWRNLEVLWQLAMDLNETSQLN